MSALPKAMTARTDSKAAWRREDPRVGRALPLGRPDIPIADRSSRHQAYLIFGAVLLVLAPLTRPCVFLAGNDASRFALIEALVDRGQTFIENSRYGWTVDRVTIRGHDYPNKPPLLSLAGAGVYAVLKAFTGWTFAANEQAVVRSLTLVLVGVPAALLASQFFLALGMYGDLSRRKRWLVTVAMAGGTVLTSFSVTLNNHVPAAALLFAALLAAFRGQGVRAGSCAGLAGCVDVLPGFGLAPVLLWIAAGVGGRRALTRGALALLGCGALFLGANLVTLGSPLLPKFVPGGVDYSANFAPSVWGVVLPDHWTYPLECLFGGHGFFTVSPVLAFGAAGMVAALWRPEPLRRPLVAAVDLGVGAQVLGMIVIAGSYGGWSYGFRYLIPVIPMLMLFAPKALGGWKTTVFTLLLPVSVLFALLGAYHPWPPAYEQEAGKDPVASMVTNPVGGNAAAFFAVRAPDSGVATYLGAAFISPDPEERARYFSLFFRSRCDQETATRFTSEAR